MYPDSLSVSINSLSDFFGDSKAHFTVLPKIYLSFSRSLLFRYVEDIVYKVAYALQKQTVKVVKMNLKMASWNVNGIRACQKKGFLDWVKKENFHIIGLQETKAHPEQLDDELINIKNYNSHFASAEKKGYSGVALYYKKSLGEVKVQVGLGIPKFDREGRTLIAEFDKIIVINGYFPNGQRDHNRVPYKLEYSKEVAKLALKLNKSRKKEVIIMGDFNTAHKEIDLKNAKTNKKTTGFLPNERKWMDDFISQGFTDIFRHKHPDQPDYYTWWTYRSDCRERNIGWRIDYFFITKNLVSATKSCAIQKDVLGSDHCPITLQLKL